MKAPAKTMETNIAYHMTLLQQGVYRDAREAAAGAMLDMRLFGLHVQRAAR